MSLVGVQHEQLLFGGHTLRHIGYARIGGGQLAVDLAHDVVDVVAAPHIGLLVGIHTLILHKAHERGAEGLTGGNVGSDVTLTCLQGGHLGGFLVAVIRVPGTRPADGDEGAAVAIGKVVVGEHTVGGTSRGGTIFIAGAGGQIMLVGGIIDTTRIALDAADHGILAFKLNGKAKVGDDLGICLSVVGNIDHVLVGRLLWVDRSHQLKGGRDLRMTQHQGGLHTAIHVLIILGFQGKARKTVVLGFTVLEA